MNAQQRVLRVLQLGHGINKLYAAQYLHIFGLGGVISRLKRKGHDIKTTTVCGNTEQSHVKYVLRRIPLIKISIGKSSSDIMKALNFAGKERTDLIDVLNERDIH